jgi:PAS domain S-box-containing protein
MSLRSRLLWTVALAVGALLLLAWLSLEMASRASREMRHLVEDEMRPAASLGKINATFAEIHARMMGTVLDVYPYTGSKIKLIEQRTLLVDQWAQFIEDFRLAPTRFTHEQQEVIRTLDAKWPAIHRFLNQVSDAYRVADVVALAQYYNDDWAVLHRSFIRPLRDLVPQLEARAEAGYQEAIRDARERARQILIISGAMSLLVLTLMLLVVLRTGRGIRMVHQGLDDLANNRFDRPLERSGGDEVARMVGALNLTARRLLQGRQEILALQRKNELLLHSVGVGIYGTDLDGVITFINPAGAAMVGWRVAELVGVSAHRTLHHTRRNGSNYPREECPLYVSFRDGRVHQTDDDLFWRKDGSAFDVRLTSTPIVLGGAVTGAVVVFEDISEQRRQRAALEENFTALKALNAQLEEAQNQLLQSEKMASIGQLAAGVAHEINNPVGFVSSNLNTLKKYSAQMLELIDAYRAAEGQVGDAALRAKIEGLRKSLDLDFLKDDLPDLIRESEDGLVRVKKIVQDLKDFSHVDESEWQLADLNAGLDSTLNVVWNEVKYKARVEKRYGVLPEVECLIAQLNQVFMNLIVNAVHAMDESKGMGTITLSTGHEGDWVWVEVEDTGKGMTPEVQKRVFEPFFTTKPVGKGTGLGLSLSFSIVQKHNGRIDLRSGFGLGSAFRVWVPVRHVAKSEDQ